MRIILLVICLTLPVDFWSPAVAAIALRCGRER